MAATIERKNSKRKTLILDESPGVRYTVGLVLGERYEVLGSGELGEGLGLVERGGVEVAILGLDYPFSYYHPFLQSLRRIQSRLPILFLVSQKGEEKSFPLSDTLGKPFFAEELREKVASLVLRGEREGRVWSFSGLLPLEEKVRRWIDSSRISVEVRERVLRLSSLPLSVLIEGEEGTGKSWVARGLHCLGSWREREFVRISCKGLTRGEFLEEIRGREVREGLDLYLEDVEKLSWEMQGYLVAQMEEGWGCFCGGEVLVRVIGSTGESLGKLMGEGEFRRDLGGKLGGVRIVLPALRERVEAISRIAGEVMRERGIGKEISGEAKGELEGYGWPGNVEELEGVVERTGVMVGRGLILAGDWVWGFGEVGRGERVWEKREGEEVGGEGLLVGGVGEVGGGEVGGERELRGVGGKGVEGKEGWVGGGTGGTGGEGVEALLSTLVHEVKNPLVAISTFAHLLPERYEDGEFRGEFSRLVGLEVRRLNGVLEMLMDYGQMGRPIPKGVDLRKRVLACLGEMRDEITVKQIRIKTEGIEELPAVWFDEMQIKFVLRRILESVVGKESERREASIRGIWTGKEKQEGENRVELKVWYDGREGVVSDIHRVEGPQGRYDFEGLNLGLGLARRLMIRNRGEMLVHQEEGVGTTILLRFEPAN